jgi:outer membrane protein insertion porin family
VVGNDKTNDRVIYRELRTKPEKNTEELLVRTIREIGQLGFFDPESNRSLKMSMHHQELD